MVGVGGPAKLLKTMEAPPVFTPDNDTLMGVVSSPFGGPTRTRTLLAIRLIESSCGRELSRVLGVPLAPGPESSSGSRARWPRCRQSGWPNPLFTLNPSYLAKRKLAAYSPRTRCHDTGGARVGPSAGEDVGQPVIAFVTRVLVQRVFGLRHRHLGGPRLRPRRRIVDRELI